MIKQTILRWVKRFWKEWRITIFIVIFVIIPVKSAIADWNWVPTGSMKPTILEGDLVFVNKAAYGLRVPLTMWRVAQWGDPQAGEIVICFSPDDNIRLVKRVLAVPGDTIGMRDNVVYINGKPLNYTEADSKYAESLGLEERSKFDFSMEELNEIVHAVMVSSSVRSLEDFRELTVPEGCYFMMGDNRDYSKDSRNFGFIDRSQVIGKAKGIILSIDIKHKFVPRFNRFFNSLK